MNGSIKLFLAAGLLTLAGTVSAAATDELAEAWLRADIVLDASGKLTSIEWLHPLAGGNVLADPLEKIVREWEFDPGTRDGVPAITKTRLSLNIEVKKSQEGGIEVAVLQANTGVGILSMPPPRYPLTAAMHDYSAELRLQLGIDEKGKVASIHVLEYDGNSQSKSVRQEFEKASSKAMGSWSFQPEEVAGRPLASQVDMSVQYCISGGQWCKKRAAARRAAGQPALAMEDAITLDSAVKIRRDTVVPGI